VTSSYDEREVERYLQSLQRDFQMQKPRLVRWVAILAVTGVGLLWALSSSTADSRPPRSPSLAGRPAAAADPIAAPRSSLR